MKNISLFIKSKNVILLLISIIISSNVYSQKVKPPVAIYDFTYNADLAYREYLPSIKQFVTSAFQKSNKFTILNRSSKEALIKESELTKGADYFLNKAVKDGKKMGARYLVTGEVDRIDLEKTTSGEGIVTYGAGFSFLIKVIDPETNVLIATEQISSSVGRGMFSALSAASSTPGAAVDAALKKIEDKIEKFIYKSFGATDIKVIEIIAQKGIKIEKVLISAGSGSGLKKGTKLEIFTPTETIVNGKKETRKKYLGDMKVERIEDENFSVCEIVKGGDVVKEHYDKGLPIMAKQEIK
ncbi:MAG: hypothetical protein IPH57_07205 [Saprospiraceae bacterium]|nr:hypothetical protein [Saprospiraceae bacterium]